MADTLQKAQLVPIDPNTLRALTEKAIHVHFNPETLKLSYTVTVKADTGSKNSSDQSAQQSSSSSAKLALDLVFDTTDLFEEKQDEADVRKVVTNDIVSLFVAPQQPSGAPKGKPIPANPCLFLWGTFQFTGLVDSYSETLEFFSASGVPLRAAVSLSLTENRYNIKNVPGRTPGHAQTLPPGGNISQALSGAGMDPKDWRGTALTNGLETPRFAAAPSIDVDAGAGFSAGADASGGTGFSVGVSGSLGTGIAGAFTADSGAASAAMAGFSGGVSVSLGFG